MKFTNQFNAHQGDVQIFSIEAIPNGSKVIQKTFFAKSEKSGHCHALCGDYSLHELENGHAIAVGKAGATLNHTNISNLTDTYWDINKETPVADHQPTKLQEGFYYIGIQRRKKPFSKVWEKVVD